MSSPKTPQSDKRARQKGNLTPKLSDKRLMPRIKEYLSTVHSSRKKHMSAEDIALALQEQYYDYARKKRRPFVQQVEEVCEWLRSKRSEEKISQLENKHLARKYHSQAKQTQQILKRLTDTSRAMIWTSIYRKTGNFVTMKEARALPAAVSPRTARPILK
jgi:L-lactate utilization protein LutC